MSSSPLFSRAVCSPLRGARSPSSDPPPAVMAVACRSATLAPDPAGRRPAYRCKTACSANARSTRASRSRASRSTRRRRSQSATCRRRSATTAARSRPTSTMTRASRAGVTCSRARSRRAVAAATMRSVSAMDRRCRCPISRRLARLQEQVSSAAMRLAAGTAPAGAPRAPTASKRSRDARPICSRACATTMSRRCPTGPARRRRSSELARYADGPESRPLRRSASVIRSVVSGRSTSRRWLARSSPTRDVVARSMKRAFIGGFAFQSSR